MKKTSRNIFFFIIVFVFFLGLAPRFFILDEVQKTIADQISKSLGSAVAINKMHWVWLPLPHLTLTNTDIRNDLYELSLPKARIYPNWRIILGDTRKAGRITLDRPTIHINKTAFLTGGPPGGTSGTSPGLIMPEVAIIIKNGVMVLETPDEYKEFLVTDTLEFSSIRGKLNLLPQEIAVNLHASSPFSKSISLLGSFNLPAMKYRLSLDCQEIKLHRSVKAFFKGRLMPVESTARISGTLSGQGSQHFEGALHGTLPSFVLKSQDHEIPLSFGFADLKLLKAGPLLRLDITDLEIKDPQGKLNGYVERKIPTTDLAEQLPTSEPFWTLDISGRDLDVTSIRKKILALWSDNYTAKTVTDIVVAGRARSAAYRFSGSTADFNDLDNMIIEADVLNADIHVPEADLDLTKASGPILIKDSILSGQGLSAQLGNSHGRNAQLLLGLSKHDHSFMLDIDIDADLAELPPVLAHLVHHDNFQRELAKFSEVSGRASGTLHLGDNLYAINTRVNVKNMQLATRYERIPQPVFIESGTLDYGPEKAIWQKVKGRIGQQEITSSSGNVSWHNMDILLHIEEMQAQLDGGSLFDMLQQTEVTRLKINDLLSSLNGNLAITGGFLQGSALKPETWEYNIAVTTSGLALTSPLLPEAGSTEKLTAVINHNEVEITEAEIQFLGQAFNLKGLLQHQHLENWHGTIEYNGPVEAKLAAWISSKGLFPEKLRPQIPCTVEDMKVSWQGETIRVAGNILQGLAGGRLPMARIDFEDTPEHLRINELTFYAPGEQGRMELDSWRLSPDSLVLSWEGFVTADTIDALFKHSSFNSGNFSGAFTISYFTDQPEATRFEGLLQAENLLLKTGRSKETVIIKNLEMKGIGRQLRIPALNLIIGTKKIAGSGQLEAEKDGFQLDISLASPFLSKDSLTNLSLAMQETVNTFLHGQADQVSPLETGRAMNITGRIGFDFDSFRLSRTATTPYDAEQTVTYTFYDVQGDLQLAPGGISRTEIFSSKLCGLDFRGSWFSNDDLGQKFQVKTNPEETSRLENVLPCLGVQQDIIEGEFSLQANLLKETNTWYGGNIHITSSQGRILRLKTLSRIFKVVNITDLFEKQLGNKGKKGFPFSRMDFDAHIDANNLIIDRAIIRGEGLNLFSRGEIHLDDYDADLTLLIAPFKTFDTIVSLVPIIGQPIIGEYGSRVSIPVAVKGPIADPIITPMHPEALGGAVLDLVKDTFMLPYNILNLPEKQRQEKDREATDN